MTAHKTKPVGSYKPQSSDLAFDSLATVTQVKATTTTTYGTSAKKKSSDKKATPKMK